MALKSMILSLLWIVLLVPNSVALKVKHVVLSSIPPEKDVDPFRLLAQYLLRQSSTDYDFTVFDEEEISDVLQKLSSSQSAFKSMDGATHQLSSR